MGAAADRAIDTRPEAFSPEEGLAVLDRVIATIGDAEVTAQVAVRSNDWSGSLRRHPAGEEPPFFRDLLIELRRGSEEAEQAGADTATGDDDWLGRLATLSRRRSPGRAGA